MAKTTSKTWLLFTLLLFTATGAYLHAQQQSQSAKVIIITDLVVVDAQVMNKKTGRIISNLKREDFELYEDGVKQEITHFSQDKLPLSILLLLDVSGSVQPIIKQLREGASQALQHLKPEDEIALMAFALKAQLIQGFTKDRQLITEQIGRVNETAEVGPRATHLHEAISQAALYINRAANPISRRVIITVTDNLASMPRFGHDPSQKEVVDQLLESGSTVCGLIVRSWLGKTFNTVRKIPSLTFKKVRVEDYADPTGGEVLESKKEGVDVKLAELIDHLRTRYSLGYVSSNSKQDGTFRKIKLQLSPEVEKREDNPAVLTKQGYYARKHNKSAAP
jgi:VWFA-related protein